MMKTEWQIADADTGRVLVERVEAAAGFFTRLRGLLGRRGLEKGKGLILAPCSSVHTFLMRFDLDIVMLGPEGEIVAVHENVPPGRVLSHPRARAILEMQAGWSGPWTPGRRVILGASSGEVQAGLPGPLRFLLS